MALPFGIAVLGATGSIGRQALEVIRADPGRFRVVALSANRDAAGMAELVRAHRPEFVTMADGEAAAMLGGLLAGEAVPSIASGAGCLDVLCTWPGIDVVLAAVSGTAGLQSVAAALSAGKRVALANKESLVMAGELLVKESARKGASILPVDSEHAATHQLLQMAGPDRVQRIILTASGGPFLGRSREELAAVTVREALAHPRWSMGQKVSIDSATMMNKGFEIIEAHFLFGYPEERIDVVIHPESIVHALVETRDGTQLAQLSVPDMRNPIAYALAYPERLDLPGMLPGYGRLDLTSVRSLSFQHADPARFPALRLCRTALREGGGKLAALAAADDVVVEAFLQGKIAFTRILDALEEVLDRAEPRAVHSLEDVLSAAEDGRRIAQRIIS